jgi:alpha-glucosidase
LLPYIYTGMQEASQSGIPLMRPMFLEFPNQKDFETTDTEFMFGPDLLVAPKVDEKFEPYDVKFPAGNWYDFWTGQQVTGSTLTVNPPLDAVPVYVRGGSILPEQPIVQTTDEVPQGPLQISVYPGPDCRSSLYQDDGNTLAYQHGEFMRMQFACESGPESLQLKFSTEQSQYKPWWSQVRFVFFGIVSRPHEVSMNGNTLTEWQYDPGRSSVTMVLPRQFAGEITINK